MRAARAHEPRARSMLNGPQIALASSCSMARMVLASAERPWPFERAFRWHRLHGLMARPTEPRFPLMSCRWQFIYAAEI